jgi:hypothetical protein
MLQRLEFSASIGRPNDPEVLFDEEVGETIVLIAKFFTLSIILSARL